MQPYNEQTAKDVLERAAGQVADLLLHDPDHRTADVRLIELAAPHRVCALPFDAIGKSGLDSAAFVAWRFLLMNGSTAIGSAEVPDDGGRPSVNFSDLFVSSMVGAVERLQLEEGRPEIRLLRVNALYVCALWVVGAKKVIVPLDPGPSFLEAGRAYREQEFVDAFP